ncbi:hypothetical protein AOC05_05110 [Arthrobacter alpinus]|uniref:GAF domain-containing protein n=1 Tax=Arthrobacter alpinus TaxID=656366 RepID=A0A0M4QXI1_9MICC|nr:GAF domain-containing protein [Arthrobacter alpinus]ALE91852.1 hypothetical protein AOC05_05110 [Arthrobacter alpinus]
MTENEGLEHIVPALIFCSAYNVMLHVADGYDCLMPAISPPNPIVTLWAWFSYQSSRFAPWTLVLASLGALCGGAMLSSSDLTLGVRVLGIGVGLVTALPSAGNLYWDSKNEDAEDVTAARERVMDESIPPLLEDICSLAASPKKTRQAALKQASNTVVKDLLVAYSGVQGVRAVVYMISDDTKRMTPLAKAGRSQRPGDFVRGSVRGDKAFETLSIADNFLFEPNIAQASDQWAGSGSGYVTFISAPIRVGRTGYGLLTLDAPKVGDLDARDGSTVSLLAATLSIYFSEANRTARNGG